MLRFTASDVVICFNINLIDVTSVCLFVFFSIRDGISLDAKFNEGNTLLHFAVALDLEDAVVDLLESGANCFITNKKVIFIL